MCDTGRALKIAQDGGSRHDVMVAIREDNPDWSAVEVSVVAGRMVDGAKGGQ